jgi:dinuclear metal center YbgI/SA1388 family protein
MDAGPLGARPGTVADWLALIERSWPSTDAAPWDRPGLQVGDPAMPVARVVVTLDVTSAVIAEASAVEGTLVVAHHPLLFRPLERLTTSTAAGRIALAAARAGVAVTAVHTNLDVAEDGTGTTDPIIAALGLVDVRPLAHDTEGSADLKLVTFVPVDDAGAVLDALARAGAGTSGAYERCAFEVGGTGRFRPLEGASPHVGQVGVDAEVAEVRLELLVPRGRLAAAVAALRASHPYEEVAFDVLPRVGGLRRGLGRVGRLDRATTLRQVAATLRTALPSPQLRVAGDPERAVTTVAAVGGSGGSLVGAALAAGADVLVTADLTHHVVLDALELGLALVDAGHHATEVAAMPALRTRLERLAAAEGLEAPVVASGIDTSPWGDA